MSEVIDYFRGKNVFLTGATGFIGKVIAEKLVRMCEVKTVFILMRPSFNQSFQDRKNQFCNLPAFEAVRNLDPTLLQKIKVLQGDICVDRLGLSDADHKTLTTSVDIVIHSAASVKFDKGLPEMVQTNFMGACHMFEIAKEIKNLKAFVYVSTAYSQFNTDVTEEKYYPCMMDPMKVVEICRKMDPYVLDIVTPKFLGNYPNTYSFTKSMGESLTVKYNQFFPISVVRPSIVTVSIKEPDFGYIDNMTGFTALGVLGQAGAIKCSHIPQNFPVNIIPADILASAILAVTWIRENNKSSDILYYNAASDFENPTRLTDLIKVGTEEYTNNPVKYTFFYPGVFLTSSFLLWTVQDFFLQLLPSMVIDVALQLSGKKCMAIRLQRKIRWGMSTLRPFFKEFRFSNDRFKSIQKSLSFNDSLIFNTNLGEVTIKDFSKAIVQGTRKYIYKEDDSEMDIARRNSRIIYVITKLLKYTFVYYVLKFTWSLIIARYPTILNFYMEYDI